MIEPHGPVQPADPDQGPSGPCGGELVLHGYWRSSAAYRVRIALNLKGLSYRQVAYDLRTGAQQSPAFKALAPQGLVPAMEVDGEVIVQSPAILEWLEERYPEPPLLPPDAGSRAVVRGMGALIACDIHPLNNLRVLDALRRDFGADAGQVESWIARWITDGFEALEQVIGRRPGAFAFGDQPTLADCYLVPQVYSAERFKVDLSPFPRIRAAVQAAQASEAVAAAHPSRQPDADPA